MKRKILLAVAIVICISIISIIVITSNHQRLSNKITDYCDKNTQISSEIKLSDFTDFEWDNVIIYRYPVTAKEISEFAGIDYEKALDIQSGMIFVKNGKVVYEEEFETDFESVSPFMIYPYADINSEFKINSFSIEDAVFISEKIRYDNENRYILKPLSGNSNR